MRVESILFLHTHVICTHEFVLTIDIRVYVEGIGNALREVYTSGVKSALRHVLLALNNGSTYK